VPTYYAAICPDRAAQPGLTFDLLNWRSARRLQLPCRGKSHQFLVFCIFQFLTYGGKRDGRKDGRAPEATSLRVYAKCSKASAFCMAQKKSECMCLNGMIDWWWCSYNHYQICAHLLLLIGVSRYFVAFVICPREHTCFTSITGTPLKSFDCVLEASARSF